MLESLTLVLLIVLAASLLVAEDLLPTFGIGWVLAACCLTLALYLTASDSTGAFLRGVAVEVVLVPVGYLALSYLVARTGLSRVASLRPPEAHEFDLSGERSNLEYLVGQKGTTLTPLRPSGTVEFEGRRLDGLAEEGLIPAGSPVEAVRAQSGQLIVRRWTGSLLSEIG